jgi:hypothetical protein
MLVLRSAVVFMVEKGVCFKPNTTISIIAFHCISLLLPCSTIKDCPNFVGNALRHLKRGIPVINSFPLL